MKVQRNSLIAILAMAGLLALGPVLRAQEEKKDAAPGDSKPAETKPPERPPRGPGGPGMSVDDQLARMSEQLSLTDEQKPKVKAVLEELNKKRAEFRDLPQEERRAKGQALREETSKKMKEILTEEQFKKYEAMPRGRGQGQGGQGGQGDGPRRERPAAGSTNAPAPAP